MCNVTRASTLLVAVLLLALTTTQASAFPNLPDTIAGSYPAATNLNNCGTCHKNFTQFAPLNPYGSDFNQAEGTGAERLAAIENLDSDGDGTSNIDEINNAAGFFPGYTCETYTEALNPPANLEDLVDPIDVGCLGATTTLPQETTTLPSETTTTVPGETTTTTLPTATTTTVPGGTTTTLPTATTTTIGGATTTTVGGGTTTTVPGGTTTTLPSTTTTAPTGSTTTLDTTTTTLPGGPRCSQPNTSGANPTASDCLFILQTSVGSRTCAPECICDTNGEGGTTASDALLCLKKAVGQSVTLECPCSGSTTTSPSTTVTTVPTTTTLPPTTTTGEPTTTTVGSTTTTVPTTTTTTGGGNIANGLALYDSDCSFCHSAGSHDTESELASDLAGDGGLLVPDLGTLDSAMDGIILSDQDILDLAAFLDSL